MKNKIFEVFASKIFPLIYLILSFLILLISIVFVFFKSKNKKYKDALPARFFLRNNPRFENNGVWFHSCSMGETKALKPLVEACDKNVSISVITNTGFEEAKKLSSDVRYLPFEFWLLFWVKRHDFLVVMEAELWFMMFFAAKLRGTKTVLINARISDKSVASYEKNSWFYKIIFSNIDFVFAQTEVDKQRLSNLGAKNIEVIGNIKITSLPQVTKQFIKPNEFVITLASSHKNEEDLILQSFQKEFGKLIIVPRHPERFDEVNSQIADFAKDKEITYSRFSCSNNLDADIVLFDKMGELINIFAISDGVILGGAFENIGGHNPIEPAFFNAVLISGKNIFNQKALFEAVKDYYLIDNNEIEWYLKNIKSLKKSSIMKQGDITKIIGVINGKSI